MSEKRFDDELEEPGDPLDRQLPSDEDEDKDEDEPREGEPKTSSGDAEEI